MKDQSYYTLIFFLVNKDWIAQKIKKIIEVGLYLEKVMWKGLSCEKIFSHHWQQLSIDYTNIYQLDMIYPSNYGLN